MEQLQQKLNEIASELAKFQLQYFAFKNEVNAKLDKPSEPNPLVGLVAQLENRVKVLEEARQKQIQLNTTFQPKVAVTKNPFWNLFGK